MCSPTLRATLVAALVSMCTLIGGAAQESPLYRDATAPVAARVRDLLSRMTLDDKVAQVCSTWFGKSRLLNDASSRGSRA